MSLNARINRKFCIFVLTKTTYKTFKLMSKVKDILSEIGNFFSNSSKISPMTVILQMMHNVKFNKRVLFRGRKIEHNVLYTPVAILQCLLLFPFFGIDNVSQYSGTMLAGLFKAHRDVFYDFLKDGAIDWRRIMTKLSTRIWERITLRADHKRIKLPTVLIFDDTDVIKRSWMTELVSKIHSHVDNTFHPGYKALFCCISDGVSQILLDLALCRESKDKNFGLTKKAAEHQHRSDDEEGSPVTARKEESTKSKIELMKEMIRRMVKNHVHFDYVLNDSWFTCLDLVKFVRQLKNGCKYLGMIKMSNRLYSYHGKQYTAKALAKMLWNRNKHNHHRKYGYSYICVNGMMDDERVRLFLTRKDRHSEWRGYLSTDLKLEFAEAFKIYAMRWGIEVVNKEQKSLLAMDKCQEWYFSAQIAHVTITSLQYNFLALAKRFSDYETIGELFRGTEDDIIQMSVVEKAWGLIMNIVKTADEEYGFDENIMYKIIYKADEMNNFVNFYEKIAS